MSMLILAAAVPVSQARDLGDLQPPLPPLAVQAQPGDGGIDVSWLPPAHDGGSPVGSYTVSRLAGTAWVPVATVPAGTVSVVDPLATLPAIYEVTARNAAGDSPPSAPAAATSACPPVVVSVDLQVPFLHPGINKDCFTAVGDWIGGENCLPAGRDAETGKPTVRSGMDTDCFGEVRVQR